MATTTIQVLEYDASGAPLSGFIRVNLAAPLGDVTTGATWLPAHADVTLVAGAATLNLLPSTDSKTNYLFEIWQTDATAPSGFSLLYDFKATVPLSTTPISLRTLLAQTGIVQDATDASIAAVARELMYSSNFWTVLQQNIYPNKGTWSSTTLYSYGNFVMYQGNGYTSISVVPQLGNNPVTSPTIWALFTQQGATGSGTTGDTAPYDATGWNDPVLGLKAPNKQVLRNKIETLATISSLSAYAPLSGANLTAPTVVSAPGTSDRSSLIPTTNWVQTLLDVLRLSVTPIGLIAPYAGTSAPTYWLLCDGRIVSTTTYAALYALVSTTYNTGGESGGTFRLPDLRGRVPVGLDQMSGVMGAASVISGLTALGTKGGETNHTLTAAEMPLHTHGASPSLQFITYVSSGGNYALPAAGVNIIGTNTTGSAGSGSAHNNLQPYNGLNYIIYAGA